MSYKIIEDIFWTDPKIKKLSVKDRYLFLYFITNPHTHYSGIYYIPMVLIQSESKLILSEIKKGIDTLSKGYLIRFDKVRELVWVVNMAKYQAKSKKMKDAIVNHFNKLHKSFLIKEFLEFYSNFNIPYRGGIEGVSREYPSGTGTGTETGTKTETGTETGTKTETGTETGTKTETGTGTKTKTETGKENIFKSVINYLNLKAKTNYRYTGVKTQNLIIARQNEGFNLKNFKKVIDNKTIEWKGTEYEKFLRPETLFGNKFEGYLNQKNFLKKSFSQLDKSGMSALRELIKEDMIKGVNYD